MELSTVGQTSSKKIYTDRDYMIFGYMHKIAEAVLSFVNGQDDELGVYYLENRCLVEISPMNPVFLETKNGFIIKVRKGDMAPASLISTLGEWKCFGENYGNFAKLLPKIVEKLNAKLIKCDCSCKYYAVGRSGELELNLECLLFDKEECSTANYNYDLSLKKWKEMKKRYRRRSSRKKKK